MNGSDPATKVAFILCLGKDNDKNQGCQLKIRLAFTPRSKVKHPFVSRHCVRLTHPVKREEAINAAEQGKGMCVMLLHQFSVSLTHCQSSLAHKTHEDIRHTSNEQCHAAVGQQWTGMSCVSKGHLWMNGML